VEKNGFIHIGKVVGAHGMNGISKVYSYAESLSVFKPNSSIILINTGGQEKTYKIKWAKPHSRVVLLALKEVKNRNQVERLIGCEILIERNKLPDLEDGVYYWCDIIGLSVFSTKGDYLGRIASIIATGSNDVYVVKVPDNTNDKEVLVPAVESVVREINLEQQTMRIDLPEGL
jgi:16S rRNA processing protein RimM